MLLKSLLFALLLSASSEEPRRLRGASEPRLNGTSSDVYEGNYTNITKRAAVSNQFNPGPRPGRHEPLSFSRRVSSDEPKPGSRFQRPASAGSAFTTGRPLSHRQHAPRPTTTRNSRRTSRHRYQHPKQTPAPSRIRNLANSAALVPPWLPNATSGLSGVIDSSCAGRRRRVTRPTARSRRLG